jgi:hypothetical protein
MVPLSRSLPISMAKNPEIRDMLTMRLPFFASNDEINSAREWALPLRY